MTPFPTPLLAFDPARLRRETFDFLIIGSGVAGLSCALELAPYGSVAVLTKEEIGTGSTQWAQGGIAAALAPEPLDSADLHLHDTMEAGAGLCDRDAVQVLVEEGPYRVRQLIARGAHFDTEPSGELKLTREAAHSARRIVHAQGDSTGREVQRSLSSSALKSAGISIFEHTLTVDLLVSENRCRGALALDENSGELILFCGLATIVATGGIGALYKVTTNPPVLTGDGMAMAYRGGAALMDMEFVQFHPTSFASGPEYPKFLISEAVRGEGAILLNAKGERFMPRYHEDAELAPRDVVSRAIAWEIHKSGADWVFLDLTENSEQEIAARFPTIFSTCVAYGINPATQPIPVSPAVHYMMGGIHTDLNGATNVPGLLACGECACTGVHGANRLASNSMLEGLVFGIRTVHAARDLKEKFKNTGCDFALDGAAPPPQTHTSDEIGKARALLRETMWQHAGLVRDAEGLQSALTTLNKLQERFGRPQARRDAIELANMTEVALLICHAALTRKESRGAHFRSDFPQPGGAQWQHHIVLRREAGKLLIESAVAG
jgi:L-aspartate oxidase